MIQGVKMRLYLILIAILCFLFAVVSAVVWSGVYNVAANVPHWDTTKWFMEKVREQSIAAHSKGIVVPSLKDPNLINAGFQHYHAMCRRCHNAPGYLRTEISQGLYPPPPDFTAKETTLPGDAEVFWIVRNGLKMTGMPAFGVTHNDEELWGMTVFARHVKVLKPEEYDAMVTAAGQRKETDHHHQETGRR